MCNYIEWNTDNIIIMQLYIFTAHSPEVRMDFGSNSHDLYFMLPSTVDTIMLFLASSARARRDGVTDEDCASASSSSSTREMF